MVFFRFGVSIYKKSHHVTHPGQVCLQDPSSVWAIIYESGT